MKPILSIALALVLAAASASAFAAGHDGKKHDSGPTGMDGSNHDLKDHLVVIPVDENEGKHDREHDLDES